MKTGAPPRPLTTARCAVVALVLLLGPAALANPALAAPPVPQASGAVLSTPAVPVTVGRDSAFTVTGTLQPQHPAGTQAVVIECYVQDESGRVLAASFPATVYDQGDASAYETAVTLPEAGVWTLRAYHDDADHPDTWSDPSAPVTVTARRDAPVWNRDGVTTIPETMASRLGARQLVVVTGTRLGAHVGRLRLFDYHNGDWVQSMGWPVRLGTYGLVDGLLRHAGSRTTPTGIWRMARYAFGTHPKPPAGVRVRWRHITRRSWWSSEHDATYNRWVETSRYVYGEHLADCPRSYEFAISSGYNAAPNPCVYGRGAGIFLHVIHSGYTAGCVAMARANMIRLLRWLDPAAQPACAIGTTRSDTPTSIGAY